MGRFGFFGGSWCGWCIKGFPELKEAYAKYDGKLEIVGIDCNDSPQAWKAAVERYELPWVQLYSSKSDDVKELYAVQNFPTKVIIDPEGRIRKVCSGHAPEFSVSWKNGCRRDNAIPHSKATLRT